MVLLNAASRARNVGSLITQNQGGGDKKAGFPYIVGRGAWTNIHFGNSNLSVALGRKCLGRMCMVMPTNPRFVNVRPTGTRPSVMHVVRV